jgi:uncharacterized protein YkwD
MGVNTRQIYVYSALLSLLLVTACGGGGGGNSSGASAPAVAVSSPPPAATGAVAQDVNAPQVTGDIATDGLNYMNYRRVQTGLQAVTRNSQIDVAAQGHSNYQQINHQITHVQTVGAPGFTGENLSDRLAAAGYRFGQNGFAYGEVISSSGNATGVSAAEDLIAAIYHRFVIFEPAFKEAGAGAATTTSGTTYFTVDFAVNGLSHTLGQAGYVVYPYADQRNVPTNFFSDFESPDPVPDKNEVGYPISIHADIVSTLTVNTFTVQPHGGAVLPVRLLTKQTDTNTSDSEAAIIPVDRLSAATVYDVQFAGSVDGLPVTRSWSFTTQ